MKTLSDSALTLVSRLSEHLGPVTSVIDSMMDRLVGQQVAQACPGALCDYPLCTWLAGEYFNGVLINSYWEEGDIYAPIPDVCQFGGTCLDFLFYWSETCPRDGG